MAKHGKTPPPAADPIRELIEALARDGKPSLAWVTRWSQGGGDPVAAAWAASTDDVAMRLLALRGDDDDAPSLTCGAPDGWQHTPCPACCDAIRRAVPVPPTLAELMRRL